jgi:hypothetical protein
MKTQIRALAIAVGLLCAASGFAQTAATNAVNAATTSATSAATNAATNAATTAKTNATAAVAAKMNPPAAAPVAAAPAAVAPAKMAAGGAGKVWVNSSSKTYHCEGSKFYGKTKTGEYMAEADAKAKGNHAVKGKACAK